MPSQASNAYESLLGTLELKGNDEGPPFTDGTFETVWLGVRKASLFRAFLKEFVKRNVYMLTANGWPAEAKTVAEAVQALVLEIRSGASTGAAPSWIFIAASETLEPQEVLDAVSASFPDTRNIHCITSCQGVTTNVGFKTIACEDGVARALSIFAVFDPLGSYSTTAFTPPDTPQALADFQAAMDAAYLRLRDGALGVMKDPSNRESAPGPEPLAEQLTIWMSGLPGTEEKTLEGLYEWGHSRFKKTVPVIGGTGADAGLEGKWRCYCQDGDGRSRIYGQDKGQGVIVTLVAASVKVFPCLMHPFTPMTEFTAKVVSCGSSEDRTGETAGRVIHTLRGPDGSEKPAGSLYYEWCEEQIQKKLMAPPMKADGPGAFNPAVLAASTACPLGVAVAREGDDAYDYRMMHPSGIYFFKGQEEKKGGAYLKAFASVETGKTDVVLFKARRGDLLSRLSKLKEQLVQQVDRASGGAESVALSSEALRAHLSGVLMVYCAGCMMSVNSGKDGAEQMRRLTAQLSNCFVGRPFLAYHPFGEQGFFPTKSVNHHSNLMFSAMCFSKDPSFEVDETQSFVEMLSPIVSMFSVGDANRIVSAELEGLLALGDEANFDRLSALVQMGAMSPELLKDLAPCSSRPLTFALHAARMFHVMAQQYPLKARDYRAASTWFKEFCRALMEAAPMHLLAKGSVLDYATVRLSVLMAVKIDAKGLVASNNFQELMEQVWTATDDLETAMGALVAERVADGPGWTCSAKARHYANVASYCVLTCLQFYTSQYRTHSSMLWLVVLVWSISHAVQTLASPTTGFYTTLTTIDDIVIVASHVGIYRQVSAGEGVPRDLDSLTMLLHFENILKGLIISQQLGPRIIMVLTMMGDVQQFLLLLGFFVCAFYCAYHALFREVAGVYTGEQWSSPTVLLLNVIWGPQVVWGSAGDETGSSLFLSRALGVSDNLAIDAMAGLVTAVAVLAVPVLLLNLLVAMMASSYQEVLSNADAEYKRSFASCVLVARELSPLPMPLSLPQDLVRCVRRLICRSSADGPGSGSPGGEDAAARRQLIVPQIISLWEARLSIAELGKPVTVEQVERMRTQGDGLQDRINVLYNLLLNLSEKIDRIESRTSRRP